jgi:mono/diheme cytochrome c family protein
MKRLRTWALIAVAATALPVVYVHSGLFDVAADVPHSALVYAALKVVRDRSISVRSKDIQVPPLNDPKLIADGAQHYDVMCAGCHLAPGSLHSEIREALYPQPPNLTEKIDLGAAETFWVVKHGIKMSAMPAWGKTHDDRSIWAIVAFVQKLPELGPAEYRALVDANGAHHDRARQHGHDQ